MGLQGGDTVIWKLTHWLLISTLVALVALSGCGSDGASPPTTSGKHLGERCEKTEDCASSLCVRVDERGGICSSACTDDSTCPRGDNWGCVPTPAQAFSVCACVPLSDKELCGDGLDNDCNGATDDCRYCDGQRVPNDDHEHCGGCDNACRSDQACRSGSCECQDGVSSECRGSCVQLQLDAENCGECGKSCGPDQICQSGQCACAAGQSYCDGEGCFDFKTDAEHCGDCDTVCIEGQACRDGSCTCPDAERADHCPGVGCVDLQSDSKHCGACDEVCADGQSCLEGACVCAANRTVCDGACKDTQNDPRNCGECGNACPAPLTCIQGECGCTGTGYEICGERCAALQSDEKNCGSCGNACAAGETCTRGKCECESGLSCGGSCVRTNDDANCGACGKACPIGQRCLAGSCECEGSGLVKCGDECLSLSGDEQNCGACDKLCHNGETCSLGNCLCPFNTTYCSGADTCVALSTDENNCGACGKQCNPTEVCNGGTCACPLYGQVYCAALGACVDVQSSVAHCGSCANACKNGETCSSGYCGCPSYSEQYCSSQQSCTDIYSNDQHCGACDKACPAGTHCSFASCVCDAGKSLCEDKCYDLANDAAHCGSCSKACSQNQVCKAGQCGCPAPKTSAEVRLTKTALSEAAPVAAFNGTNVGALYLAAGTAPSPTNLRFSLIKPDGSLISDSALTSYTDPNLDEYAVSTAIAWTGSEFGVAFVLHKPSANQVMLQRLDATGASKGPAVVVGNVPPQSGTYSVALAWSASYGGYGVAYRSSAGLTFRRVGATGTALGPENAVLSTTATGTMQLVAAADGTWGMNAIGSLAWFNADGSRTLPLLALNGDVSLVHDGSNWLATFTNDSNVSVQRGTSKNQAVLWSEASGQAFGQQVSTMVGGNLAVLLTDGSPSDPSAMLQLQRFVLPASSTSTSLSAPTTPIDLLPGRTCPIPYEAPHNFALVATGARALLAVWADSRWGLKNELYAARIDIPSCP